MKEGSRDSRGDGSSPVLRLSGRFWDDVESSPPADTRGGHRRKTLAPPAWNGACAESRFECLGGLRAAPSGLDNGRVAVEAAEEVLTESWPVSRDDVQRPTQYEGEIVAEFWEKVGYLTSASRLWECSSPATSEAGKGTSSVCRSPEPMPKGKAFLEDAQSMDGAAVVKKKPPGHPLRRPQL